MLPLLFSYCFPQEFDDQSGFSRAAAQLRLVHDLHHQVFRQLDRALAARQVSDAALRQLRHAPIFRRSPIFSQSNSVTSDVFVVAPLPTHSAKMTRIKFSGRRIVRSPSVNGFIFFFVVFSIIALGVNYGRTYQTIS